MKKIFLKGKAFLHQKMEELDIEHTKLDLVVEQTPKKLQRTFQILSNSDIDLQSFEKYSLYYRTYPNHPIASLLSDKIKLQKQVLEPGYVEQIRVQKDKIPMIDQDLEEKAYKLRNIIEGYSQGIPQHIDDLLGIGVVQFHHKRGAQMQYIYPETELTKSIFNNIIPFAMPDSSHNKMQDCSLFNLPFKVDGQTKMIYGISYFKQVKITEDMKVKNQELTRSHLQKSVCILSFVPLFGQFKLRIMETTNRYFDNLTDFSPIKQVYDDLKKNLQMNWKNISLAELHIGIDAIGLLTKFKLGLFKIYKAILHNKRVIFFSQSAFTSSSAILSVLSLFPGQLMFSMRSDLLDKYLEGLREYALPLKLFSTDQPLILSANIQIMSVLKALTGGFVIGTSNIMLIESLNYDMLVDIDKEVIKFKNDKQESDEELSIKDDKIFIGVLNKVVNNNQNFQEGWLRDHFHCYLKKNLAKISDIKYRYNQFISLCRSYEDTMKYTRKQLKNEDCKSYSTFDQQIKQQNQLAMRVPQFDNSLTMIPLIKLIHKPHFRYFLEFSSPDLHMLTNKYYSDEFLAIDNYEYYLGTMPRSKSKYITYNYKSKRLRICNLQSNEKTKIKQAKFNEEGKVSELFIGDFDGNVYNGHGMLLTIHDTYEGGFRNGMKDGFGKLVSSSQTYIGTFYEGLFHGDGHLITNETKTIYVGMFKQGLRDGYGKLQTSSTYYQGEFSQNQMCGNGSLTIVESQIKYFGTFSKNKLQQNDEQSVIRYPNGDVYTGTTLDMKPHGRGILHNSQGKVIEGQFQNGQLKKKQIIHKSSQISQ